MIWRARYGGTKKKLVAEIIEHGGVSSNYANQKQTLNQLYRDIELPGGGQDPQFTLQQPVINNGNDAYNITHEAEEVEESLSLIEKESDLIRKALKKLSQEVNVNWLPMGARYI